MVLLKKIITNHNNQPSIPFHHLAIWLPRLTKKPDLTDIFDFTDPWGRKSAGNHFLSTNFHEFTQITSFRNPFNLFNPLEKNDHVDHGDHGDHGSIGKDHNKS